MKTLPDKIHFYFTSALPAGSNARKARMLVLGSLLTILFMIYYAWVAYMIDFYKGLKILPLVAVALAIIPFALKYGISQIVLGNLFAFIGLVGILLLTIYTGGIDSPVLPWMSLVPLVALLFVNKYWAVGWMCMAIAMLGVLQWMSMRGLITDLQYNPKYRTLLFANCYLGLVIILYFLNQIFESSLEKAYSTLEYKNKEISSQAAQIASQRDIIAHEKQKSDDLLLNVLPAEIADELKSKGSCEARRYEQVTILFTDFVDFTKYCETITPEHLIYELDKYFKAFDEIMVKYGLEKIKTIGDAYMAVSGLPHPDPDHAIHAIHAARELMDYVKSTDNISDVKFPPSCFKMTLGIHSGTVIAGVVGTKKFAFDVWGDAVNTAARVQQKAQPNTINVSQDTYEIVKDRVHCSYRGKLPLKGKGDMDLWEVK